MHLRLSLLSITLLTLTALLRGEPEKTDPPAYRSPYEVRFTFPEADLIGDLVSGPRGDPKEQSSVPFADWYSAKVRQQYGVWGPPSRAYPAPDGLEKRSAAWKRERVIAVGLRYRGYSYQHHHLPDWDPPADWPWKEVGSGHNGKGVDCSNFTAFVYNQGLGLKMTGQVVRQSELREVPGSPAVKVERIEKPATHAAFCQTLKTGDLVFVRNNQGEIAHVVLWVGTIGQAPDGAPLILDSTGSGRKDCHGATIPDGVQLRPCGEKTWYYQSASHALRLIADR